MGKVKSLNQVFQLKITLRYIEPPVWRRVQVSEKITLYKLHRIIQAVMSWEDCHLHQFMVGDKIYGEPDPDGVGMGRRIYSERAAKLNQVVSDGSNEFQYEYDFGDGWLHDIEVEKVLPGEAGAVYPACLEGERNCPPEDCGGPPGYEQFLAALVDPKHPDHEEYRDWLGDDFDAEAFDLLEVNQRLRRIR